MMTNSNDFLGVGQGQNSTPIICRETAQFLKASRLLLKIFQKKCKIVSQIGYVLP